MARLEVSEKISHDRYMEIVKLKRVQNDQGKALEKMVNENDYPAKFKTLMEELRAKKDKIRELEEA